MELVRNWQGTRVILLVRQFQASLDAGLLCSRIWPNLCAGRNCGIILAQINKIYCALLGPQTSLIQLTIDV